MLAGEEGVSIMRYMKRLAVLGVFFAVMLSACSRGEPNPPGTGGTPSPQGQQTEPAGTPSASSSAPSPSPTSPASQAGGQTAEPENSAEEPDVAAALPGSPIEEYVALPKDQFVEALKALSDREVLVTARERASGRWFEFRVDMEARTVTALGEIPDRTGYESVSPTGEWTATWDRDTPGIWGVSARTGEKGQWTKGNGDWSPIWRSDGSGFYYLHDTGENLGDGAGPKHALAHYDIRTGKQEILPFEQGFWGHIAWLDPDRSIVAYNGFDDVTGVKIVNLRDKTEKQILKAYINELVSTAVHPAKARFLVSRNGWFIWYDGKGNEIERVAWPDGLDEYTKKSPRYTKEDDENNPYYELTGGYVRIMPHLFRFSPDGGRLAYLLGVTGMSVDDPMPGTRIVVSRDNGAEPAFVTPDYARISCLEWAPSGDRLFVAFNVDDAQERHYVGWVRAGS